MGPKKPAAPLEEISLEDLARIFGEGGDLTRWSQLGIAVPRTPCPILLAVRGDDPVACRRVVDDTVAADGTEAVRSRETFVTNQGSFTVQLMLAR